MLNVFQLEQSITKRMHAALVPGFALAVVRNQDVIYARGFGVTSVEDGGVLVTPQTLFRIASLTKPLVGTAVMRLVEMGILDLDMPIKAYVDWLRFSEKGMEDRITLGTLLSHTSGIAKDFHFGSHDPSGLETFVRERLSTYPFLIQPGRMWLYSNVGLMLVGYIAQVVSGKPFTDLMQELVFTPLEMKRTTFDPFVAMNSWDCRKSSSNRKQLSRSARHGPIT
jgi:CubicO group peptidase (beta-lactamase class C family)